MLAPVSPTDAPVTQETFTLTHLSEVDSTNDHVLKQADSLPHGSVILANRQRSGRGRRGRAWHSPTGNLYMTVLLKAFPPLIHAKGTGWLTLAMALAVCQAVRCRGLDATIKWPNDVLLAGGKMAGVLAEGVWEAGRVVSVALGVGVNLNMGREEVHCIDRPVAVLSHTMGVRVEPILFAHDVLDGLARLIHSMNHGGVDAIRPQVVERLSFLGTDVQVDAPGGFVRGTATGIDDRGALLIVGEGGELQRAVSGEMKW